MTLFIEAAWLISVPIFLIIRAVGRNVWNAPMSGPANVVLIAISIFNYRYGHRFAVRHCPSAVWYAALSMERIPAALFLLGAGDLSLLHSGSESNQHHSLRKHLPRPHRWKRILEVLQLRGAAAFRPDDGDHVKPRAGL